jgi:hypothetical protein
MPGGPKQRSSRHRIRSNARARSGHVFKRRPGLFDIDIEHCPHCAGRFKIIAAIEDPPVIAEILGHLNLPARAPQRSPAQRKMRQKKVKI